MNKAATWKIHIYIQPPLPFDLIALKPKPQHSLPPAPNGLDSWSKKQGCLQLERHNTDLLDQIQSDCICSSPRSTPQSPFVKVVPCYKEGSKGEGKGTSGHVSIDVWVFRKKGCRTVKLHGFSHWEMRGKEKSLLTSHRSHTVFPISPSNSTFWGPQIPHDLSTASGTAPWWALQRS